MLCERHRAELCLLVGRQLVGLWAELTRCCCLWALSKLVRKDASRLASLSFSQILGSGWGGCHLPSWQKMIVFNLSQWPVCDIKNK